MSSLNTAVNSKEPLDCQKRRSTRRVTHTPSGLGPGDGDWGLGSGSRRVCDDSDGKHDEKLHPLSNRVNIVTNHYKGAPLPVFSKHISIISIT